MYLEAVSTLANIFGAYLEDSHFSYVLKVD